MRKSRYIWAFQSRRSLLIWKIFGAAPGRLQQRRPPDGSRPRRSQHPAAQGTAVAPTRRRTARSADVGYTGSIMPPPEAVAGTMSDRWQEDQGRALSDEDRLTLVRWIDLGCPIDLDYDPANPKERGYGWMLDDNRPTLTLTYPKAGANPPLTRILVGMHDYDTGLDMDSFQVVADFALDGVAAGQNLASKFKAKIAGVWEWTLAKPLTELPKGKLTVSVRTARETSPELSERFPWEMLRGRPTLCEAGSPSTKASTS